MGLRWAFAVLFAAIGAFGVVWMLGNRRRVFEFPFLISIATTSFLTPQMFIVVNNEWRVPTDAFCITLFHGCNCLLLAYLGYFSYRSSPSPVVLTYDPKRLFQASMAIVAVGYLGYIAMDYYVYGRFLGAYRHQEGLYSLDLRGLPVYLMYIARLTVVGLMICMIAILLRPRPLYAFFFLAALLYPMLDVVVAGRRNMLVMLAAVLIFPLYYVRRLTPPRWAVVLGGAAAFCAIVLLPEYRKNSGLDVGASAVQKVEVGRAMERYMAGRQTLEFPYGMLSVGAVFHTGGYGYGVDFYNALVKQFLPRGLVGDDYKRRWFLPGATPEESHAEVYGRAGAYYLSESGIVDSFWEFGFFGAILFFMLGRFWAWLYDNAVHSRDRRFVLASCVFAFVPPYVVYGGFLSAVNRCIPMFLCFWLIHRYARIAAPAPSPRLLRARAAPPRTRFRLSRLRPRAT
jgi:hypothetical protein